DLARGVPMVATHLEKIADAELRTAVRQLTADIDARVVPRLAGLRRSVIHGDANDFNVIVDDGADLATRRQRIAGIIDFGDLIHSYTVGNLAVAASYVLLDKPDPLRAAAHVVAGYHAAFPLTEPEIAVLFGLMTLRLCLSVCHAADQRRQRPD